MRVTTLAAGGYLGYLVGGLTDLLTLGTGLPSGVVVGAEVIGAVAGVVLFAEAPLLRRLPLCPASLRNISGRPLTGVGACRATRLLHGVLGASAGAVAAGIVALPLVLAGRGRNAIPVLFVTLPVAGAAGAVVVAGRRRPCAAPPGDE